MNKKSCRTIVDAIMTVLNEEKENLTSKEIYKMIEERNLYDFQARNPEHIVSSTIRRHCLGIDFPTASPVKHFVYIGKKNKKCYYGLLDKRDKDDKVMNQITNDRSDERLPEERMKSAYDQHCENIKKQLLEKMNASDPAFFESLVIELLIRMGYGYDKMAGERVGKPHDGGIDGIIYEDKLGLDKIYIQAKRYKIGNTVARNDVQAFSGAVGDGRKGVFITSSKFSKEAIKFIEQNREKHIKLMDGDLLVENMIRYQVGVTVVATMNAYKIDNDYFLDEE